MVFANSDSCNTLVSFDEGVKKIGKDAVSSEYHDHTFRRTELVLPEDDFDDCDGDEYFDWSAEKVEQHVYIPVDESDAVDLCLRSIPQVMETADELLAKAPRHFSGQSRERVLYVAQGEMAHAVPSQCDVIVSDKATTCHILALRSTTSGSTVPLVSLTHIDATSYENCIRDMIYQHKIHHFSDSHGEEKKEGVERINMDVHIMGGFQDADEQSRAISNFVVRLLAQVADEERSSLCMTLKTCAISSMNDNGYSCPIGRGMGIDLHTGESFLAKVDESATGPASVLRSVRLWAGHGGKQLSVIHTTQSNNLVIAPFDFRPFPELDILLKLPDRIMLQHTSTSPDVEENDFCFNVRRSLTFMRDNKSDQIFGAGYSKPLLYSRYSCNEWKRC